VLGPERIGRRMKFTITLNTAQLEYLEAYGKVFGYDAEWAAMQFVTEGILDRIDSDMLAKARAAFDSAKKICGRERAP
jgi:hypothetical protein